jgi:hypothetical protein
MHLKNQAQHPKVIYVLKMRLFAVQLRVSDEVKKGLEELTLFYVLVYVKTWMTAPLACDAAVNDLRFYRNRNLETYKYINSKLAEVAINKLSCRFMVFKSGISPSMPFLR